MLRKLLIVTILFASLHMLAGCGGGILETISGIFGSEDGIIGDGDIFNSEDFSDIDVNLVHSFVRDGSGIARLENDNIIAYVLKSNFVEIERYFQNGSGNSVSVDTVDFSNMRIVEPIPNVGHRYEGTLQPALLSFNKLGFINDNSTAFFHYSENGLDDAMIVGGTKATNLPSGTVSYSGFNAISSNDSQKLFETGTFNMNIDFSNKSGNIIAKTETEQNISDLIGTTITVNLQDGSFQGFPQLSYDGQLMSATIYLNFHGEGAEGVSGLYYVNGNMHQYQGVIVGSKL